MRCLWFITGFLTGVVVGARAAVLLLPGWEQSKGARLERDWAIHLNLEIFDPPATPEEIPPAAAFRRRCR
jgi:hypothetical protein